MKRIPWHTILIVFYSVLFLFAENIEYVKLSDTFNPLLHIAAGAILVFGLSFLVFRSSIKAGIFTSIVLLLFFSYGHYHETLYPNRIPIINVRFDHNFYKWSSLILCIIVIWRLFKAKTSLVKANKLFNFIALLLIAMPVFKIVEFNLSKNDFEQELNTSSAEVEELEAKPSVYYFIMDAYGRNDVFEEMYGFDNSPFTDYLKEKGFYVADESFANYNKTVLSIPSSLNMTYLDSLAEVLGTESENQTPLLQMIDNNKTLAHLKDYGYSSIAFDAPILQHLFMDSVDLFYETPGAYVNLFENELLNTSIIRAFRREKAISNIDDYEFHRKKLLSAFDKIVDISKRKEPFYVHGHILAPHQPFVFNAKGEAVNPKHYYACWIPIEEGRDAEEYKREYIEQLQFINQKLKETIDAILANSETPPIIIIQGDHGPCSELTNTKSIDGNNFHERMPIINAYYFPDQDYKELYPTISPVNSFRLVFSKYFKLNYPLLPDSSYYSTWNRNYDFVNVTDSVN